jgi:hypothetical protein
MGPTLAGPSFIDKSVQDICGYLNISEPSYVEFRFCDRRGNINSLIGRGVYVIHDYNEAFYVGMSNTANTGGMRLRFLSHLRKIKRRVPSAEDAMTESWRYFLEEYSIAMDLDLDKLYFRAYHMAGYKPSKILALESILIDRLRSVANDEIYNEIMESLSDSN